MATDVDFVNLALNNLGADQIVALSLEDSAQAAMAVPIYLFTLDALLSAHSWRFATTHVQLARLTTSPKDSRYKYEYALPNATLRIVKTNLRSDDYILYRDEESGYRRLYSNRTEVWADIVLKSDSSLFPPHFQIALVAALTAALALPITRRGDIKASMEQAAAVALATAIAQDWNEQPWPELDDGDWLVNAKYGGATVEDMGD